MKKLLLACVVSLLVVGPSLGQYSDEEYRGMNFHNGNQIRTVFYNYGLVGNVGETSFSWPEGTDNEYIGDYSPILGLEFVHPSGDTLHSCITCLSPRQSPEYGETGEFWGFEAVPGYCIDPDPGEIRQVTMSNQQGTWPSTWPNRDAAWDNQWIGMYQPGQVITDLESYFMMDDHNDMEWRYRFNDQGEFVYLYPFPADTTRGGLGIEMEVRYLQFDEQVIEDAIYMVYIIHNRGSINFERARFGVVIGTLMGGRMDSEDDMGLWHSEQRVAIAFDSDDNGGYGWDPIIPGERNVGILICDFPKTPGDVGITSFEEFSPPGSVRMNDDAGLWNRMDPGRIDDSDYPEDGDLLLGTGDFSLQPGESDTVVVSIHFIRDWDDMWLAIDVDREFCASGWDVTALPDPHIEPELPTTPVLSAVYPNPFNDRCQLEFALPAAMETRIDIYNTLGQKVRTLTSGLQEAGRHSLQVETQGWASGIYFVRMETAVSTQVQKIVLLR